MKKAVGSSIDNTLQCLPDYARELIEENASPLYDVILVHPSREASDHPKRSPLYMMQTLLHHLSEGRSPEESVPDILSI